MFSFFHLPILAIFILFALMATSTEAIPVGGKQEGVETLNELYRRSTIERRQQEQKRTLKLKVSLADQERLIKRGIIRSRFSGPSFDPSTFYANKKKRFIPMNYPPNIVKSRDSSSDNSPSMLEIQKRQDSPASISTTTSAPKVVIPTANVTPTSVNHDTSDSTSRTSAVQSGSAANSSSAGAGVVAADKKADNSTTSAPPSPTDSNSPIQLPKGVQPASEGFLFLPVTKSAEGAASTGGDDDKGKNQFDQSSSSSSTSSTSSTSSSSSHQTYFFNIESPSGGQISSFKVNGGSGQDATAKPDDKSASQAAAVAEPKPSASANAVDDKTRIIFKPLQDPNTTKQQQQSAGQSTSGDQSQQPKSAPSTPTPTTTPPTTSKDSSNNDSSKSNSSSPPSSVASTKPTSTSGASQPGADDKSAEDDHDHDAQDDKSPTTSDSTSGSGDEKKKYSSDGSGKKNEGGNSGGGDGGSDKDKSSSDKPKENGNGGGGGDKQTDESKDGKSFGGDKGDGKGSQAGQDGGSKGGSGDSGGGGGKGGGSAADSTSSNQPTSGAAQANSTTPPPTNPTPKGSNGGGKEDNYYLFPIEQGHKTVELNTGDMVAYVDHPQSAASQFTGSGSSPPLRKRQELKSTIRIRNKRDNILFTHRIHPRQLITTNSIRTAEPKEEVKLKSRMWVKREDDFQHFNIRSFSMPFSNPFKHIFTRSFLQPGLQKATPTYWTGEPLRK